MAVAGSSAGLLIGGTQHAGYVDAGGHPESLEGGAQHLGGAFPAPAPSAQSAPSICSAPFCWANTEFATPSERFWCTWNPT